MKEILVACGTGKLTSFIASEKLKSRLKTRGINSLMVKIDVGSAADVYSAIENGKYDLLITTVSLEIESPIKIMSGVPLLTGKGIHSMIKEVMSFLF
jgi:galactitol-specific phosphotransferase system IIB component